VRSIAGVLQSAVKHELALLIEQEDFRRALCRELPRYAAVAIVVEGKDQTRVLRELAQFVVGLRRVGRHADDQHVAVAVLVVQPRDLGDRLMRRFAAARQKQHRRGGALVVIAHVEPLAGKRGQADLADALSQLKRECLAGDGEG